MCVLPQRFSHYPAWPPPVDVPLVTIPDHPCVYLPDRLAQMRAFRASRIPPQIYQDFMDAGFRRSGQMIYQPTCMGCRACVPLRVPVEQFRPNKSQRRCLRKNADLQITISAATATDEKYDLYRRYLRDWHAREPAAESREEFQSFLYESPVETVEFSYRSPAGQLLAVGICDVCPQALSSVYCYFDPAHAHRGLGTFSALCEINYALSSTISYYYLGYWIEGCPSMKYKSDFSPCEVLDLDSAWRPGRSNKQEI